MRFRRRGQINALVEVFVDNGARDGEASVNLE
jgi:hypothetical protein